jgi:hypothetical protein
VSNVRASVVLPEVGNLIAVASGNRLVGADTGSVCAPGTTVQVANSISGPTRYTFNSATPQVVTGLSIAFTPRFSTSLILVRASISGSNSYVNSYGVFKDGVATVSTAGQTNLNEPNMQVTQHLGTTTTDWIYQVPVMYYETAGSTAVRTYAIYVTSAWAGTPVLTYVNNRASNDMASFSYMSVMEIAQ